jgi:hypothetical protein
LQGQSFSLETPLHLLPIFVMDMENTGISDVANRTLLANQALCKMHILQAC